MANTNLVIDMITDEALRIAHEKLTFIGTIDNQYDDSFAQTGGKIGSTLRIRQPNRYVRRKGSRVMVANDNVESAITATVATQDGVDMAFTSDELALDIDKLSKRHIAPAMATLVSGIEGDMLTAVTKDVYNLAGTAGTPPATLGPMGDARAKLNQNLAPKDSRCIQMDSVTMSTLVTGLSTLFHDQKQVGEQYREGMVGRTAMADYYENERTYSHTVGADVAGAINQTSFSEGMTTLTIDGMTGAPAVGDIFTIDSVFAIHPETRAAYSHLQQFTVTDDTTPSTTAISFSPAIYWNTSGTNAPVQNVDASPANNDALAFVGTAAT
ncbi:MAG: hypothetical protein GY942_11565, partial [Aestuariibacter sp.]|nr:hypothetical protein [Aestuariibacter sp.]